MIDLNYSSRLGDSAIQPNNRILATLSLILKIPTNALPGKKARVTSSSARGKLPGGIDSRPFIFSPTYDYTNFTFCLPIRGTTIITASNTCRVTDETSFINSSSAWLSSDFEGAGERAYEPAAAAEIERGIFITHRVVVHFSDVIAEPSRPTLLWRVIVVMGASELLDIFRGGGRRRKSEWGKFRRCVYGLFFELRVEENWFRRVGISLKNVNFRISLELI